uniref:Sulfatase domain-containing protein n=1 Tax=Heterorhabditis bacteriophora TaxID=37862 RepID=A0A1I7X7D0_HETBA
MHRTKKWIEVPENTRYFVNADAFYIRCFNKSNIKVFESIFVVEDTPSFDSYGRKRKALKREKPQRLSIDILGFDSTSRTMFYRHLPRTLETMNRLGYETLYGYNKVGDNSMVNLGPILIGDVPEALTEPMLDESGDINSNWILPANKKMDPTALRFLWKLMKEKYGCRSMLNEDISRKELGLFHYPLNEFLPGFTEPPADHFYRAYYLAVYKNWSYGSCRDGRQIQRQFVDLWRRFAVRYKDICHFGFTFVTTLSHEVGFLLELLDEHISSSLENLLTVGALDNTVSVVMGDHGNRIGLAQYSYTGRIEERMPLMAIRFPPWFRSKYREEYNNFRENRWKLTRYRFIVVVLYNFDVHQTLKDIALMRLGTNRSLITSGGRGISLFDKIPDSRLAKTIYFIFYLASLEAVRNWIIATNLSTCIDEKSVIIKGKLTTLGLNPLARHGLRSKSNVTVVRDARRKEAKLDVSNTV